MADILQTNRIDELFDKISALIEQSRNVVAKAVKTTEVYAKYEIDRYIIEDEQGGEARAQYGKQVLKALSDRLTTRFGNGCLWKA